MRCGRPARHGLRQVRAQRGEEVVQVVADRLVRARRTDRGPGDLGGVAQVAQRQQRDRVLAQVLGGAEQLLERDRRARGCGGTPARPRRSALFSGGSARGQLRRRGLEQRRDRSAKSRQERRLDPGTTRSRRRASAALSSIVSWSATGSRPMAANVSAISANQAAWTPGHRRRLPERLPERREQPAQLGAACADRARMTGSRRVRNGLSSSIVRLSAGPRPASAVAEALQRLAGVVARLRLEGREHVLEVLGRGVAGPQAGSCPRPGSVSRDTPGVRSTYFRPSAERGRTLTRRVHRQRLDASCRGPARAPRSRARAPFTRRRAPRIFATWPMRKPPARTSLPFTSFDAFGSSASIL